MTDILCIRSNVDGYDEAHPLSPQQHWVMTDPIRYRTASFGTFSTHCDECGMLTIQYASYRNRHHVGIALKTLFAAVKKQIRDAPMMMTPV